MIFNLIFHLPFCSSQDVQLLKKDRITPQMYIIQATANPKEKTTNKVN